MKTKNKLLIIIFLFLFIFPQEGSAEDDFQYWSRYSLKMVDTQKIDWTVFAEARLYNDTNDLGLYYLSQKLSFDLWKNLSLGTNYTYLNNKSQSSDGTLGEEKFQHRLELEVDPKFNLGESFVLKNRNRIEFRWIEDHGSYNTRLRHRWTIIYKLKNTSLLKDIYTESEFFYNIAEHTYDENRTIPFGLTFKVNKNVSLKTFYMIQSKLGSDDWRSNQILGTQISLGF